MRWITPGRTSRRLASVSSVLLMVISSYISVFAAPGDLDPGFGVISSGLNYTDVLGLHAKDWVHALALQTDGAVVVAGESNAQIALARYGSNGLLDTSNFGAPNGAVTTSIILSSTANAVAIQGDGMIVVAGSANDGVRDYFAVARYDTSGALDTAGFNAPFGYITSTLSAGSDVATSLVLQSDGKIVVAGYTATQFAVARYNTNGTLDTTGFNAPNGFRTVTVGVAANQGNAVGLQSDGKILVAGHADTGQSDDFVVTRFTTAGGLDTTFNGGFGYVTTDFPTDQIDLAQALAIQPDDKIVVAGYTNGGSSNDFAVARYTANGTLDTTFGNNGLRFTNINTDDQALGVAIQPTGRIVLAGTSINNTSNENLTIVRYTNSGALDTSFGVSGHVTTDVGGKLGGGANTADFLEDVVIQSDNMIVAAGYTDHPLATGDDNFVVARYQSPNTAPTVSDLAKSGPEDVAIPFAAANFSSHFADADGDTLAKIQVTSLPVSGTLTLSGTVVVAGQEIPVFQLGLLAYQPNQDDNGPDAFGWNGSDGLAYAATGAVVNITVTAVNDPPVNAVPVEIVVDEDNFSTGNLFSVSDVDAGAATNFQFSLSAVNGSVSLTTTTTLTKVAGANGSHQFSYRGALTDINAALADVGYQPDANYHGSDTITFSTNDKGNSGAGGAQQATSFITVTVNQVNDAPVLDPIGDKSVDEGATLTFDVNATDVDAGQTLAYSLLAGAPAAATIDPTTGVFSWATTEADGPGLYPITVQVADNGVPVLTDAEALTITVNKVNDAPIITDVVRLAAPGVVTFTLADFTAGYTDLDGDPMVTLKVTSLPDRGILEFGGAPVTVGQEITATKPEIRRLKFMPDAENLSSSAFAWSASDGTVYATNDALMTVLVGGSRVFMPHVERE